MSVVVGTAGHIDHGKTTLLRALTGIDADRLPEEQRRGMTIDVGYAHLALADGDVLDFVDVPGHDRLVGNMLVGAGEIDAVLLVVAADDGPRAQTIEHVELLAALGLRDAVVAVTKADVAGPERTAAAEREVGALLAPTRFAGAPLVACSGVTGQGIDALRAALVLLRDRVRGAVPPAGEPRLAVDRVFTVRGRGTVVTGSLRGGLLAGGSRLRHLPAGGTVRVREVQVRGRAVGAAPPGRTALNLAGVERDALARGDVLTTDPAVTASSRLLVRLTPPIRLGRGRVAAWPPGAGTAARLHSGTAQVDAVLRRGRRDVELDDGSITGLLRLGTPLAATTGDRFVLRNGATADLVAGGTILDPLPPTGAAWRRTTSEGVRALATAGPGEGDRARLALHGALPAPGPWGGDAGVPAGPLRVDPAVATVVGDAIDAAIAGGPVQLATLRPVLARVLRRHASVPAEAALAAASALAEAHVIAGRAVRRGDLLHAPGAAVAPDPARAAALDRLVATLDVPAPPPLEAAARAAGCPPEGIRELREAGRLVDAGDDVAWSTPAFKRLAGIALALAARGPLAPAALRDATGLSRRYVMPLLEELGRRRLLVRTPAGHVPGPRAGSAPE